MSPVTVSSTASAGAAAGSVDGGACAADRSWSCTVTRSPVASTLTGRQAVRRPGSVDSGTGVPDCAVGSATSSPQPAVA
jgi:hypothetical protein